MIERLEENLRRAGYLVTTGGGGLTVGVYLRDGYRARGPMQWVISPAAVAGLVELRRVLDDVIHTAPGTVDGVLSTIEAEELLLARRLWPHNPEFWIVCIDPPVPEIQPQINPKSTAH